MKTMRVYFVTDKNFGESIVLQPRIPESANPSEPNIKRICCCPTIYGCLKSMQLTSRYALCDVDYDAGILHWVYQASVDVEKLIQPPEEQVGDAWHTGELWILEPHEFTLTEEYIFRRCQPINSAFSRYSFHINGVDEVPGCNELICGDEKSFSFVELAHDFWR